MNALIVFQLTIHLDVVAQHLSKVIFLDSEGVRLGMVESRSLPAEESDFRFSSSYSCLIEENLRRNRKPEDSIGAVLENTHLLLGITSLERVNSG
jgi:hypothetical protein